MTFCVEFLRVKFGCDVSPGGVAHGARSKTAQMIGKHRRKLRKTNERYPKAFRGYNRDSVKS